jgi:hypothetical protein
MGGSLPRIRDGEVRLFPDTGCRILPLMTAQVIQRALGFQCQSITAIGQGGCFPAQVPYRKSVQGLAVAEISIIPVGHYMSPSNIDTIFLAV